MSQDRSDLLLPAMPLKDDNEMAYYGLSRFEVYFLSVISDLITIRKRWDKSMADEAVRVVDDMFEAVLKHEKEIGRL